MISWEQSGTGTPIVFVHGITEDRHSWHSVVPLLEDSFRCICLDLRGHGQSSDADDYTALAMADDVAVVVAEAHITEPPLVVGHSLGGFVVTAYAANAPVRGVVNVDQLLHVEAFATELQSIAPKLRGPQFADTFNAIVEPLMTSAMPEDDFAWATAKHRAARQEVVVGVWGALLDSAPQDTQALVDAFLPSVQASYLAIHRNDPGEPYRTWLKTSLPNATLEVWPGDAHYPHLVEPEHFAARIRDFIAL
jgi:pimeloyl-ACP methyl ester carboxylesterase